MNGRTLSDSDEKAVTELMENMTESQAVIVPVMQEYMNPLLEVLRSRGQALPIEEVDRLVIAAMNLSADIVAIRRSSRSQQHTVCTDQSVQRVTRCLAQTNALFISGYATFRRS